MSLRAMKSALEQSGGREFNSPHPQEQSYCDGGSEQK